VSLEGIQNNIAIITENIFGKWFPAILPRLA